MDEFDIINSFYKNKKKQQVTSDEFDIINKKKNIKKDSSLSTPIISESFNKTHPMESDIMNKPTKISIPDNPLIQSGTPQFKWTADKKEIHQNISSAWNTWIGGQKLIAKTYAKVFETTQREIAVPYGTMLRKGESLKTRAKAFTTLLGNLTPGAEKRTMSGEDDENIRQATAKIIDDIDKDRINPTLSNVFRENIRRVTGNDTFSWGIKKHVVEYTNPDGTKGQDVVAIDKEKEWYDTHKNISDVVITKTIKPNWLAYTSFWGGAIITDVADPISNKYWEIPGKIAGPVLGVVGKAMLNNKAAKFIIDSPRFTDMIARAELLTGSVLSKASMVFSDIFSRNWRIARSVLNETNSRSKLQSWLLFEPKRNAISRSFFKDAENFLDSRVSTATKNKITDKFIRNGLISSATDMESYADLIVKMGNADIATRNNIGVLAARLVDPEIVGATPIGDEVTAAIVTNPEHRAILIADREAMQRELADQMNAVGLNMNDHYIHLNSFARGMNEIVDKQSTPEWNHLLDVITGKVTPPLQELDPYAMMIPQFNRLSEAEKNRVSYAVNLLNKLHPQLDDTKLNIMNMIAASPVIISSREAIATARQMAGAGATTEEILGAIANHRGIVDNVVRNAGNVDRAIGVIESLTHPTNPNYAEELLAYMAPDTFTGEVLFNPRRLRNAVLNASKFVRVNEAIDAFGERLSAIADINVFNEYTDNLLNILNDAANDDINTRVRSINMLFRETLRQLPAAERATFKGFNSVGLNSQLFKSQFADVMTSINTGMNDLLNTALNETASTYDDLLRAHSLSSRLDRMAIKGFEGIQAGAMVDPERAAMQKITQMAVRQVAKAHGYDTSLIAKLAKFVSDKDQLYGETQVLLDQLSASAYTARQGAHIPRATGILQMPPKARDAALSEAIDVARANGNNGTADQLERIRVQLEERDTTAAARLIDNDVNGDIVLKIWRERYQMTDEVAKALQVMDNILAAHSSNINLVNNNISKGMLYQSLNNAGFVRDSAATGFHRLVGDSFGPLNNRYVPNFLYKKLMDISRTKDPHIFVQLLDKISLWSKKSVLFSAGNIMRNLSSNQTMAMMGSNLDNLWQLLGYELKATADLANAKRGNMVDDVLEYTKFSPNLKTDLSSFHEIINLPPSVEMANIVPNKAQMFWESVRNARKLVKGFFYEDQEHVAKLAIFKALKDQGVRPDIAVARAEKYMIDYGDVTALNQWARRTLFPFVTYPIKMIPVLAEETFKHPEFATKLAGKLYRAQDAIIDRQARNEYINGLPDQYKTYDKLMFVLPSGNVINLAYFLPHAVFATTLNPDDPVEQNVLGVFKQFLHPILQSVYQAATGVDQYGRKIIPTGAGLAERLALYTKGTVIDPFVPKLWKDIVRSSKILTKTTTEKRDIDQDWWVPFLGARNYSINKEWEKKVNLYQNGLNKAHKDLLDIIIEETKYIDASEYNPNKLMLKSRKANAQQRIDNNTVKLNDALGHLIEADHIRDILEDAGCPTEQVSAFMKYYVTTAEDEKVKANLDRATLWLDGKLSIPALDAPIVAEPNGMIRKYTNIPKAPGVNIPKYSNIPKYMPRPNTEVMSEATKGMQPNKEFSNPRVKDVNQP